MIIFSIFFSVFVIGQCFSENCGYRGILSLPGFLGRTREPDFRHEISKPRKLAVACQVMSGAISVSPFEFAEILRPDPLTDYLGENV